MNITATASIEIRLNEHHIYKLTKEEAEQLYVALGEALNKSQHTIQYPAGVRGMTDKE